MKIDQLYTIIVERINSLPKNSYVTSLLKSGKDNILQKIGEETTELILASKNGKQKEIVMETADLFFHVLVLLGFTEVSLKDVYQELERRNKK